MLAKCQRCSKKHWVMNLCNYCGKVVCNYCIKAMKKVKNRAVAKLHICKSCWSDTQLRKKYKNGIPVHV